MAVLCRGLVGFAMIIGWPVHAHAAEAEPIDPEAQTILSNDLWISTRGEAMSGALTGLADGTDAPLYNPAGIGGLHQTDKGPFIRQLHFPLFGASANDNAIDLNNEFNKAGAVGSATVAKALVDANAGKRQFGRLSVLPNIVLSRMMLSYVFDTQFAAVSQGAETDQIGLRFRQVSGPGVGISASDSKGRFYLGLFAASVKRDEAYTVVDYATIADPDTRKKSLKESTHSYHGNPGSAGFIWVMSQEARPALSLAARDVGGTQYTSQDPEVASLRVHQNFALAFSTSPQLGKWGYLNFAVEADRFHEADVTIDKKLRAGLELSFGHAYGNRSAVALRSGYSAAGAAFGLLVNIGLIGIQCSDQAVDVGAGNKRLIERRKSAIFSINVAEY